MTKRTIATVKKNRIRSTAVSVTLGGCGPFKIGHIVELLQAKLFSNYYTYAHTYTQACRITSTSNNALTQVFMLHFYELSI